MRRSIPLLAAVLLAGILAGGAVGVIVGASTVPQIHACAEKATLLMRYTTSTSCKSGEKLVTWNVAGVAGPKGATGAAGAPGATGPQGSAGSGGGGGQGVSFYLADGGEIGLQGIGTLATLKVPAGSYLVSLSALKADPTRCVVTTDVNAVPTDPNVGSLEGYQVFGSPVVLYARCYAATPPAGPAIQAHEQITATLAQKLPPVP